MCNQIVTDHSLLIIWLIVLNINQILSMALSVKLVILGGAIGNLKQYYVYMRKIQGGIYERYISLNGKSP